MKYLAVTVLGASYAWFVFEFGWGGLWVAALHLGAMLAAARCR